MTEPLITVDSIQTQIPSYLTQNAKEQLAQALNDFSRGQINYYISKYEDESLQGDGWTSLELIRFEDGERKKVRGILLSNSCDIDPNNQRALPPSLVFAPIIPLTPYLKLLENNGVDPKKIGEKLSAIREQRVTNLIYLPRGAKLNDDYVALLDDLHTIPLKIFSDQPNKEKLFTLSQVGFYLFTFKLSLHFCRLHENVDRS